MCGGSHDDSDRLHFILCSETCMMNIIRLIVCLVIMCFNCFFSFVLFILNMIWVIFSINNLAIRIVVCDECMPH